MCFGGFEHLLFVLVWDAGWSVIHSDYWKADLAVRLSIWIWWLCVFSVVAYTDYNLLSETTGCNLQ